MSLNTDLQNWLIAQGDGNLEQGIARAALKAGYRPPQTGTWRVPEAIEQARLLGYELRQCTVNAALKAGRIRGATQPARDWVIEPEGFIDWLKNRYTPRPRKGKAPMPVAWPQVDASAISAQD